jgi:hypothetical protein
MAHRAIRAAYRRVDRIGIPCREDDVIGPFAERR